jgi:hypothetical protein
METWAILVLVIGLNIITVLSSYFLTKMQVSHSDKRLEKELERAREEDRRRRRWEIRSEPLLKFRDELANIATKLHTLIINTQFTRNQSGITEEEQQKALEDWRDYMTSGVFLPTLYLQFDKELINRFEQIENTYLLLFEYALDYKKLKGEELKSFREISQKVKDLITEVQEIINKKLEEL